MRRVDIRSSISSSSSGGGSSSDAGLDDNEQSMSSRDRET